MKQIMLKFLKIFTVFVLTISCMFNNVFAIDTKDVSQEISKISDDIDLTKVNWAIYSDGALVLNGDRQKSDIHGTVTRQGTMDLETGWTQIYTAPWYSYRTSIKSAEIAQPFAPESIQALFCGLENLTTADLSNLDTSNLVNMKGLFSGDSKLTNITFGDNFDTSKVTDMSNLAYNCAQLEDYSWMNQLDVASVEDMGKMFMGNTKMTSFVFPNSWNTSNVKNMEYMFQGNSKLSSISFGEKFNTSSVQQMRFMFQNCSVLTEIIFPEKFVANSLQDAQAMFAYSGVKSITFPNTFIPSGDVRLMVMFANCSSLERIYANTTWSCVESGLNVSTQMFANCPKLYSESSEKSYNVSDLGVEWANPKTGYFTSTVEEELEAIEFIPTFTIDVNGANVEDFNEQFEFELKAVSQNAPLPNETVITNSNGVVSWGSITFSEPGVYKYQIIAKEMSIDGIISEEAVYQLAIEVKNVNGQLVATPYFNYVEEDGVLSGDDDLDIVYDYVTPEETYPMFPMDGIVYINGFENTPAPEGMYTYTFELDSTQSTNTKADPLSGVKTVQNGTNGKISLPLSNVEWVSNSGIYVYKVTQSEVAGYEPLIDNIDKYGRDYFPAVQYIIIDTDTSNAYTFRADMFVPTVEKPDGSYNAGKTNSLMFCNIPLPEPEYGSLQISKEVKTDYQTLYDSWNKADDVFTFEVTIGNTTETIQLKAGESYTFDIPLGSSYTIKEVDIPEGYTLISENPIESTITLLNPHHTVTFINQWSFNINIGPFPEFGIDVIEPTNPENPTIPDNETEEAKKPSISFIEDKNNTTETSDTIDMSHIVKTADMLFMGEYVLSSLIALSGIVYFTKKRKSL